MTNQLTSKEFLIGAALGGLLGTVTALMVAPKSGKRLRQDIADIYSDISEKTQDTVDDLTKKSKTMVKKVNDCSCDIADKAKCLVHGVSNWMGSKEELIEDHSTKDLVLGSIAGGILGAVAGLLLAPKPGVELREDLEETYNNLADSTQEVAKDLTKKGKKVAKNITNQTNEWLSLAKDVVDQFTGNVEEIGEDVVAKGKKLFNAHSLDDIKEWATLGMRIWHHMKKRG